MNKINPVLLALILLLASCSSSTDWTDEQITEFWTSGKTLPAEVLKQYPLPKQPVSNYKGYNVLIDMAHECSFNTLWTLPEQLNSLGYRSIGSHALISSVLDPDGESRIRMVYDTINKIHPFVWMPNPEFHVIVTVQDNPESQIYTDSELEALQDFVSSSGGILAQGKSACEQIAAAFDLDKTDEQIQKFEYLN